MYYKNTHVNKALDLNLKLNCNEIVEYTVDVQYV